MKIQKKNFSLGIASLSMWLAVGGIMILPSLGIAQIVNLSDGGSTAQVNLGSSVGMDNWTVLGQNQLNQQWFWYSVNGGAAQAINTIATQPGGALYYTTFGTLNTLDATYSNAQVSVSIQYQLTGAGPGSGGADMSEDIAIDNMSNSSFNIAFYHYSYFSLLGANNNTVNIYADGNQGYNYVSQTSGATAIQEAIDAPDANFAEAAPLGQTLGELNNNSSPPYNLNDTLAAGPGNVTWAFEWTNSIDAGGEFDITKDKSLSIEVVPEPSSIALIALGLGAGVIGLVRRRQS